MATQPGRLPGAPDRPPGERRPEVLAGHHDRRRSRHDLRGQHDPGGHTGAVGGPDADGPPQLAQRWTASLLARHHGTAVARDRAIALVATGRLDPEWGGFAED